MILLDWLMQVQLHAIKVLPSTLWLAVGILDRYLSLTPSLKRDQLQLVGATAFLLAIKIEEHSAPALQSFAYSPAQCAAGAIYAARFTAMHETGIHGIVWTEELADESQMDAAQVSLCASEMLSYARTPIAPTKRRLLDTLHRKYANKATQYVSEVEFPAMN